MFEARVVSTIYVVSKLFMLFYFRYSFSTINLRKISAKFVSCRNFAFELLLFVEHRMYFERRAKVIRNSLRSFYNPDATGVAELASIRARFVCLVEGGSCGTSSHVRESFGS